MKRPERDYVFYLEDILESISKIKRYTSGIGFDSFVSNEMIIDAVIRNLEIVGEAANKIPNNIKEKYSNIPWSEMYRMRNRAIHEYFGVDYEIIWSIIKNHLPDNYEDLKNCYADIKKKKPD